MKHRFLLCISALCITSSSILLAHTLCTTDKQYNFLDITQIGQEQYQDIFINGQVIKKGSRECTKRYQAIKQALSKYNRPITVLDIGASQGYFSFNIARDFDATCVMIEVNYRDSDNITDQLLDLCKLNTDLDNIIFLEKRITADDLTMLGKCEHFDVVLCLNVVHHTR
jgi:2-polyprenyl-3-methyl-5-hydroxy-6-metoxy-1,4-benzoquinol methylase